MFKSIGALFHKLKESEDWRKVQREDEERRRAQAEAGDVLDLDDISDVDAEEASDEISLDDIESLLSEADEEK